MASRVLTCRICGNKIEVSHDIRSVHCEYCGQKINVPTLDERLLAQCNRGTYLRQKHEFENAYRVYQRIVSEYPEEPEVYWGLVLSRYGVDYVDERGKKIPTLNRMQYQSILKDADYNRTVEFAKGESKVLYQDNAAEIARIQNRYFAIVKNEAPYDVFICYKDTEIDNPSKPTMDRMYAQEIYNALTEKGYKVFFSHISLEQKLGTEYEPYIFAALNSASVMLVVGTSKQNLESVWVKNEWSRFLDIVQIDSNKKIIPVYRDMDAYDLPKEFLSMNIQGVDYSRLGAQQLIVEKVTAILQAPSNTIEQISKLLTIAKADLQNGMPDNARNQYERVLRIDPANFSANLGLLLIDLGITDENELHSYENSIIDHSRYWTAVMTSADEDKRKELIEYLKRNKEAVDSKGKEERLEKVRSWVSNLSVAAPINKVSYENRINELIDLIEFKDADQQLALAVHNVQQSYNIRNLGTKRNLSREYEDDSFRSNCQNRLILYQEFREYLEQCKLGLHNSNGLKIIKSGIKECREWEDKINAWLKNGKSRITRIKIKRVVCLLIALSLTAVGYLERNNVNLLVIIVPSILFFLISIHQVEPSIKNLFKRLFLCIPYSFFTWRIVTANPGISLIIRAVIWGAAAVFLFFWGIEGLFIDERDDDTRNAKMLK